MEIVRELGLDRLERWVEAALARPSFKATEPDEGETLAGGKKFVKEVVG